jgi:2-C-methyl-D-erythritol 2,4-cyclodiphosphate synthase
MMRVGLGYDIHTVELHRRLVLGGVEIESGFGLRGHSDADVVLHAIMDALLGAAALGDIGRHFPPSEDRFRGISSLELLAEVRTLLERDGWSIVNVDAMVVAEGPQLGPFIPEMRERISLVLGVEPSSVSVKATTNEGVGPEGRGDALSAQAVALIESAP